ncbi:MAG: hypothetical protein MUE54_10050 [Anaerolineae bacterium]|jgi:hypothetical protein|nr:hypothetical protein [Anaerolineae bacterium]
MEKITTGIVRSWLYDHQVALYRVENVLSVGTMVDWGKAINNSLASWQEDADYIAIHDISSSGMSLPYLVLTGYEFNPWLMKGNALFFDKWLKSHPAQKAYLAVVVSSTMSGNISMKRAKTSSGAVESEIFDNIEVALAWVQQFIKSSPNINNPNPPFFDNQA